MGQGRGAQDRLNDDDGQPGQQSDKFEFLIPFTGFGKNHPGGNVTEGEHPEKEHNDIGLCQAGQVYRATGAARGHHGNQRITKRLGSGLDCQGYEESDEGSAARRRWWGFIT